MPPVNDAPEETTPKVDPTSEEKRDEGDPTQKGKTDKDDPSRTAGIPNWGWLLLFMVLAATPVALVVKSWKTPPATTHQTQSERPAPPQSQSPADKASAKTEQKLSALEAKLDELKDTEKRLSVLEARLDDTYSTVEAVGFSAGLFGVLITVITLFFALKESERVKDAMNRIESIEKQKDNLETAASDAKKVTEQAKDISGKVDNKLTDWKKIEDQLAKLTSDVIALQNDKKLTTNEKPDAAQVSAINQKRAAKPNYVDNNEKPFNLSALQTENEGEQTTG